MAKQKSTLSKAAVFLVAQVLYGIYAKIITDLDVRTACQHAGIAAVGQNELTGWLKEFRDSISDKPIDRLVILAESLPENFLLTLVAFAQEYVTARVETVYQEDTQTKSKLQQTLLAKEQSAAKARDEIIANIQECERLKNEIGLQLLASNAQSERIRALEMENAMLLGRLAERSQYEKAVVGNVSFTAVVANGEEQEQAAIVESVAFSKESAEGDQGQTVSADIDSAVIGESEKNIEGTIDVLPAERKQVKDAEIGGDIKSRAAKPAKQLKPVAVGSASNDGEVAADAKKSGNKRSKTVNAVKKLVRR